MKISMRLVDYNWCEYYNVIGVELTYRNNR